MMLLAVSLGSILVIGYLSGRSSRAALTQAAFDHLISVRAAKAHEIETYARNLHRQPLEAAALLHEWVDALDRAAERHGLERHSLIGERCLVVCGLTTPYLDHVNRALDFALEAADIVQRFNIEHDTTPHLQMGIHAGPVMAGIVGATRFHYDLWGEAVNIASDLQRAAAPGGILVSQDVYERTRDLYGFATSCGHRHQQRRGPGRVGAAGCNGPGCRFPARMIVWLRT